jgi:hypothetical protein
MQFHNQVTLRVHHSSGKMREIVIGRERLNQNGEEFIKIAMRISHY